MRGPRVIILASAAMAGALSAAAADDMTAAGTFGDWALLTDASTPHQFCFITSEPKATSPKGASRDAPRAYVSAWPKDGIRGEVSFRMGFPVKKSGEGKATISPADFVLFGSGDRAFVNDATQELKLVEAMKKGNELTIEMTSERGTLVTDTYSLAGIGQALKKLQESCF
jgi:hypothetical protein